MIRNRSYLADRSQIGLLVLSILLIAASTACNGTSSASLDEEAFLNAVDTAVAATDAAQAQAAQKTQVAEALSAPTETTVPSVTTAPNTPTPEPTITFTALLKLHNRFYLPSPDLQYKYPWIPTAAQVLVKAIPG